MKYAIQGTKTTKAGRESLDNTKKKLKDWSSVLDKLGKNKERYNKRAEKRDKKHPEYAENVPEIQVEDLANFLAAYRQLEPLKRDISNIQS
ncbi:MAG: hypothetical protein LBI53_03225 [Candidatus Peribacteria bacterium]|jgi:hypothetical protein|nr:hypothetical protein [Candidatus Peribacteria bacterium]